MAGLDYSRVAGLYRWVEFLVFGARLQRARVALLQDLMALLPADKCSRILVVGDGDGRFLEALLAVSPDLRVDYVDCSAGMMRQAQARMNGDARVEWFCGEMRDWRAGGYAAVVGHFLLDGFGGDERLAVVEFLVGKVQPGGGLLVSDFDPSARLWAPVLVRVMQVFFALSARLPFVRVIRDDAAFVQLGGVKVGERLWQSGWIYTQLWKIL